jgi:hypothetical protein
VRTYVTSYPHEYTLAQWCGAEAFGEAIRCIEAGGEDRLIRRRQPQTVEAGHNHRYVHCS